MEVSIFEDIGETQIEIDPKLHYYFADKKTEVVTADEVVGIGLSAPYV